ncbi:TPA: hypothetical protein DEO28_04665 [Candidatus Dependentiae bacterium]|nr:MAG: hypothetical protein UR14_C0002G0051 [candidate division TM6 bacterium GW2011_GWE2_31_21]KKP53848.1 MAG: hypothetical protein UR43_C0002G0051 [candidate division TM6 bacterium GW2011_GWF2_33_332]HBS47627.1 hypothetical protein [Candidatus Dependentiae bacterium]HBZ73776.1 hypothetical protein [Candidatus Dependentiae bacterium]
MKKSFLILLLLNFGLNANIFAGGPKEDDICAETGLPWEEQSAPSAASAPTSERSQDVSQSVLIHSESHPSESPIGSPSSSATSGAKLPLFRHIDSSLPQRRNLFSQPAPQATSLSCLLLPATSAKRIQDQEHTHQEHTELLTATQAALNAQNEQLDRMEKTGEKTKSAIDAQSHQLSSIQATQVIHGQQQESTKRELISKIEVSSRATRDHTDTVVGSATQAIGKQIADTKTHLSGIIAGTEARLGTQIRESENGLKALLDQVKIKLDDQETILVRIGGNVEKLTTDMNAGFVTVHNEAETRQSSIIQRFHGLDDKFNNMQHSFDIMMGITLGVGFGVGRHLPIIEKIIPAPVILLAALVAASPSVGLFLKRKTTDYYTTLTPESIQNILSTITYPARAGIGLGSRLAIQLIPQEIQDAYPRFILIARTAAMTAGAVELTWMAGHNGGIATIKELGSMASSGGRILASSAQLGARGLSAGYAGLKGLTSEAMPKASQLAAAIATSSLSR